MDRDYPTTVLGPVRHIVGAKHDSTKIVPDSDDNAMAVLSLGCPMIAHSLAGLLSLGSDGPKQSLRSIVLACARTNDSSNLTPYCGLVISRNQDWSSDDCTGLRHHDRSPILSRGPTLRTVRCASSSLRSGGRLDIIYHVLTDK